VILDLKKKQENLNYELLQFSFIDSNKKRKGFNSNSLLYWGFLLRWKSFAYH